MASAATATSQMGDSQAFKKVEVDLRAQPSHPSTFDPSIHMSFTPPTEFYTLDELSLNSPFAVGHVAITAPFPLFSNEGVRALRADLFRPEVVSKHSYRESKTPELYKIRGYGKDAPFVYSTWTSPEILAACSKAAGVELEVVFDYEIGHINVQLPQGVDKDQDVVLPPAMPPKQDLKVSEEDRRASEKDEGNITAWHNDSYPWVCVCMLSDSTGMVGGETALRTGDGKLLKVRGPGMGYAVMMQGGLINHVALKALGGGERITMVTSFRPKDPNAYDNSNLGNVKKVSDHAALFGQWSAYRAENLAKRALAFKDSLVGLSAEDISRVTNEWAEEQIAYLKVTAKELTDEGAKGNYNHNMDLLKKKF
ncbi:uncharacterized protein LY89DRAFT_689231 [Mollisia scopiformis]|uniref:Uncharacterized protein n=1 Tax=Mollisia scopiformis TaxID=149040 RepID=A0A194WUM3_MOLSC|nr:uncharacterized protein LY89DRAFT_689231 [Mollisia scopiformis]KUJ11369.1 hypothetical protein LY89DRAFT_689231 [Mollisia scopiformis]